MTTNLIGISFGTGFSCISIVGKVLDLTQPGTQPMPIANEDGDRQIPSYVAFTGHEVLCGTQAKVQALANPLGTIFQFRNILGKSYADDQVQHIASKYRMNIVGHPEDDSMPAYEVKVIATEEGEEDGVEHHSVHQVTAAYLAKLKETAEYFTSKAVHGCVISIPAHFEESQKEALLNAAKEAGFETTYPIHESVAASLAYDNGKKMTKHEKNILVLDLGAQQFNITYQTYHDGLYTIKESVEVDNLGGANFDEILVEFARQEFKRKYKCDVAENRRSMQKLRTSCERTKRALSRQDTAPCQVESLFEGMDYNGNMIRARFDALCEPLYTKCKQAVLDTIKLCNLTPESIDQVLLIGGSSKMPRFQAVMKALFPNPDTDIQINVDPDEVISVGCAVQAKIFLENITEWSKVDPEVTAAQVTSVSIGIETSTGEFYPVIPAGTPIPVRREVSIPLADRKQTEVYLAVYQGESQTAKDNELLAELVVSDMVAEDNAPRHVDIVFAVEMDLELTVVASEKSSGQKTQVSV